MHVGEVLHVDPNHVHHHKVNYQKAYGYAKSMEKGDLFPPVKVYVDLDGKLLVSDGAHRSAASKMVGQLLLIEIVGMASVEEDYSEYHTHKPEAKDFWYKKVPK